MKKILFLALTTSALIAADHQTGYQSIPVLKLPSDNGFVTPRVSPRKNTPRPPVSQYHSHNQNYRNIAILSLAARAPIEPNTSLETTSPEDHKEREVSLLINPFFEEETFLTNQLANWLIEICKTKTKITKYEELLSTILANISCCEDDLMYDQLSQKYDKCEAKIQESYSLLLEQNKQLDLRQARLDSFRTSFVQSDENLSPTECLLRKTLLEKQYDDLFIKGQIAAQKIEERAVFLSTERAYRKSCEATEAEEQNILRAILKEKAKEIETVKKPFSIISNNTQQQQKQKASEAYRKYLKRL